MIRPISEAHLPEYGGKARGLARLMELGMRVPAGWVLVPGKDAFWQESLRILLGETLEYPLAVRSSALAEDGEDASFAGQFDSFLNCTTAEEVIEAVKACQQSANEHRVGTYRQQFGIQDNGHIPVVLQTMVRAAYSGVIFTAHPVEQRADRWMLSVCRGTGEKLMSGEEDGEQVLLSRNGMILEKGGLLEESQILEIFEGARKIHRAEARPMDMEWAIDHDGLLYWLQARPVTALERVHINELDGSLFKDNEVFTRANIGEMMPGPVTPLTYSVFGRAIEVGLQDFYKASGALEEYSDDWIYFRMFYNHLFFSMTRLVDISEAVLLNKQEDVEFAIMGDTFGDRYGDYRPLHLKPFLVRLTNQIRQFRYLGAGKKRAAVLRDLAMEFRIPADLDMKGLYRELDRSLTVLNQAYAHHYCASSQSGSYQSALMAILKGGKGVPDTEHYRDAAFLMTDLQDLESADVLRSIDHIYDKYREAPEVSAWLKNRGAGTATATLEAFRGEVDGLLAKHGHRGVREGELREKSWEEDPESLYQLLLKIFETGKKKKGELIAYESHRQEIFNRLAWFKRKILSRLLPVARAAVARREFTKSMAVKIQQEVKSGYRRLAGLMVEADLLDDADQIFFLTHAELGLFLDHGGRNWKETAAQRRLQFPASFKLQFEDSCQGYPEPMPERSKPLRINGDAVKGLPVSAGSVEARIRVVKHLDDAACLEEGEIMVCQYTDVGWTPYFSLASGLITEIGSPLSHGAVVAREYGIPAVVNAKGALGFFATGDRVLLDGSSGVVKKLA